MKYMRLRSMQLLQKSDRERQSACVNYEERDYYVREGEMEYVCVCVCV